MKKIVVIGGGFAGISALRALAVYRRQLSLCLIDKKTTFDFLPGLPDVLGGRISARHLKVGLKTISIRYGANFINAEAQTIDFSKKTVIAGSHGVDFDYLIIASGSQTNFYNNHRFEHHACVLDSASDAEKGHNLLLNKGFTTVVVVGGGYTGIEVATQARRLSRKQGLARRIVIIEKASSILGSLPQWMKSYVSGQLKDDDIEIRCDSSLEMTASASLKFSNGESINNVLLIWCAGVRGSDFAFSSGLLVDRIGRIVVDNYLSCADSCFVAGDAAAFNAGNGFLRMSVQFAVTQGARAARNIILAIAGKPLRVYKPFDPGYIIPLATNKSCGRVFGFNLRGRLPTLLHYSMCAYRSASIANALGIIKDVLSR